MKERVVSGLALLALVFIAQPTLAQQGSVRFKGSLAPDKCLLADWGEVADPGQTVYVDMGIVMEKLREGNSVQLFFCQDATDCIASARDPNSRGTLLKASYPTTTVQVFVCASADNAGKIKVDGLQNLALSSTALGRLAAARVLQAPVVATLDADDPRVPEFVRRAIRPR